VTVGSSEALYITLMALAEEGDEELVPNPYFPLYLGIVNMTGAKAIHYRLPAEKGFAFDFEEFRKKITDKTRAVILASPSNPTGRVHTRQELLQMAEFLQGTGIYVVSDEIYRDIFYTEERPSSISEFYDKTLVVSGLSKSFSMTGWRLGWLTGPPQVIKTAMILHAFIVTCTSTIAQKSALSVWTDEGKESKEVSRIVYKKRREHLLNKIKTELGLPTVSPEGAFFILLDVRSLCDDEMEICEMFLENRVITVAGKAFGSETEGFLRLSFCCDEEKITEGVRRMKEALFNFKSSAS